MGSRRIQSRFVENRNLEMPELKYDIGDLDSLKKFFPFEISKGFNGDVLYCNIDKSEYLKFF